MADLEDIAGQSVIAAQDLFFSLHAEITHEQIMQPVPAEPGDDAVLILIFPCILRDQRLHQQRVLHILFHRDHLCDLHDLRELLQAAAVIMIIVSQDQLIDAIDLLVLQQRCDDLAGDISFLPHRSSASPDGAEG